MSALDRAALALLSLILATLLALYLANAADSSPRRPTQRQIDRPAEMEYGHPKQILYRHRRYERAKYKCYPRRFNNGKAAVCGPHQILVWDMTSRDGKMLARIVNTRGGAAWAGALLLKLSRDRFNRECGKRRDLDCVCEWQRLNNGDRDRLCARLAEPTSKGDES